MDVFNGYLTDEERESALFEAKFDVEFSRCEAMLEMVDIHFNQQVKEAEYKVFSEGGTYDDYQYLLEEAKKEAATQEKGILTTMIDGIIGFFKNIIDAIAGFFAKTKVDPNANYNIPDDKVESVSKGKTILTTLKTHIGTMINQAQAGNYEAALKEATTIAAPALLAIGVGAGSIAAVKSVKGSDVMNDVNDEKSLLEKIMAFLNDLKTKASSFVDNKAPKPLKDLISKVQEIAKVLKEFFDSIAAVISGTVGTLMGKDHTQDVANQQANAQPAPQNGQPAPQNPPANPAPTQNPQAQPTVNANADAYGDDDMAELQRSIFGNFVSESYEDSPEVTAAIEAFNEIM